MSEENKAKLDGLAEELAEEIQDFDAEEAHPEYSVWAYGEGDTFYKIDDGYSDVTEAKRCFDYVCVNFESLPFAAGFDGDVKITVESDVLGDIQDVVEEFIVKREKSPKTA